VPRITENTRVYHINVSLGLQVKHESLHIQIDLFPYSLFSLIFSSVLIIHLLGAFNYYHEILINPPQKQKDHHKIDSWLRSQSDLKRRIKETCQKYNLTNAGNHLTWAAQVKLFRRPKIMFCINHKAGSSTLRDVMRPTFRWRIPHNRIVTSNPRVVNRHSNFRFSFVRNPYTRLISSYEDKIVKRHSGGYIGEPFRNIYHRINITFAEFIAAVVKLSRENCREDICQFAYLNIYYSFIIIYLS